MPEIGEIPSSQLSPETFSSEKKTPSPQRIVKSLLSRFHKGKEDILPAERVSRAELEQYRPDASKFPHPKIAENFFHPLDHLGRTLIWSDIMANLLPPEQQDTIDRRVLRIASVLHDVGRGDFHLDKHAHGGIAAELIRDKEKLAELLPDANTQTLTDQQINDIAYLVENHHQRLRTVGAERPELSPTLQALKTADIIDLARGNFALGGAIHFITDKTSFIDNFIPIIKHGLNKTTPHAKRLRSMASTFATKTQKDILNTPMQERDRFAVCLNVAQEMNLIRP